MTQIGSSIHNDENIVAQTEVLGKTVKPEKKFCKNQRCYMAFLLNLSEKLQPH